MKVTIIIPAYNVENYILRCLDSLKSQTYNDFEIIIVDDGSKDNLSSVVEKYIKENPKMNINFLTKENGGLASARNFAIKYAKGEYILFLDADDYLEKDLLENLKKYMEQNIDLIKFKMQKVDEKGNIIEKIDGPVFEKCSGEEAYKKLCTHDLYMDPACIYLYKKDFFVEKEFEYRYRFHEDFGLTSLIIINAKSFVSTDFYGYNYVQTSESLTRSKDLSKEFLRANDLIKHYDYMLTRIYDFNVSNYTKDLVKRYYTNSLILKVNDLEGQNQKDYIKNLKKRKIYKNIKPYDLKQLIKRFLLMINIKLYLKMR